MKFRLISSNNFRTFLLNVVISAKYRLICVVFRLVSIKNGLISVIGRLIYTQEREGFHPAHVGVCKKHGGFRFNYSLIFVKSGLISVKYSLIFVKYSLMSVEEQVSFVLVLRTCFSYVCMGVVRDGPMFP